MTLVKYSNPVSSFFNTPSLFDEFYKQFDPSKKIEPNTNIAETTEAYDIELAVPGFKKEDVNVKIEQDKLIISSAIDQRSQEEDNKYYRKEIITGNFESVFQLPKKADLKKIVALHENGVLKIHIPKQKEDQYTKTIKIQ